MSPERAVAIFDLIWPPVTRVICFVGGLIGLYNEAVNNDLAEPVLLAFYGGMLAMTPILGRDIRQSKEDPDRNVRGTP